VLSGLLKKRPNSQIFRLGETDVLGSRIAELLGSHGLFEGKHVIVLEFLLGDATAREIILAQTPALAQSEHIVLLLEEALDAAAKKTLTKHAADIRAFDAKEKTAERFNVFSLADAVARRDKKAAWVALQCALRKDLVPEEIHGVLWWQVKTLLRVAHGDTEGLKPFAISKAKHALSHFSSEALDALAERLVAVYHDAHGGGVPLAIGLEQFVLGL
jgi:DNA polymerase III delta subunit